METIIIVRLGVIIFLCQVLSCGFAEESSCTPGFESELLVFKVHRDHLHRGKRLGIVPFNACDGRSRKLFQSVDKRFDVKTDGTVEVKRQVTLHEGQKVFAVHAWDSSGKKHTVSVRIERAHNHHDHQMDTVVNTTPQNVESPINDLVLKFPKASAGLKRAKRGWVIPPFNEAENSRGPFPKKLVQIKSDFASETQMVYRITGEGADLPPMGIFTCDKSGNLRVTQPLDREKKPSYKLIAHAESSDGMIKEKEFEIIVNVIDQNDNKPVFSQNPFNGHVHEAAPKDYEFMTVTATDADDPETDNADIRYKIMSQEPPLPNPNMFDINSVNGVIRVINAGLDREKWSRYTLLIQAADMQGSGLATTGTAVITVTDSNDNAPQFEQTTHVVSVPENKVGAVVAKLTVTDGDEVGSPAWTTKYQIISGDKGGFFNISTGPSQLEGIITTVKPLDYEKTKQYILSVIVENDEPFVSDLPTSTATVTVNVEDVNEPPEFFPNEKLTVSVPENKVGAVVAKLKVTDGDEPGSSPAWKYQIVSGDEGGFFNINTGPSQLEGIITTVKPLDFEKNKQYILTVTVISTATVIVNVEDDDQE